MAKPKRTRKPNKSAIVITDSQELGDKRLNEVESLAKLKEENEALTAKTRKPDQDILGNKDMAQGEPMEWQHLVYLLQKLNSRIIVREGGVKGALQIRYPSGNEMDSTASGGDGTKYVTGFYKEVLPEFSWEAEDDRGRPTREIRGWRTVLVPLIKQGIVSYKDAVDMFGEPNGQRSYRWKKFLREHKI